MTKTTFNILAYPNRTYPWKPQGLYNPSSENKKNALAFIEQLQAQGGTFTGRALKQAFGYSGVDTIYFLSDGEPTGMKPPQIIEMVNQLNQHKKVTIYALGFKGANRAFMENLATQNGGDYKDID